MNAALYRKYETLVAGADAAFAQMQREYPAEVRCRPGCTDCCHAVFGLFFIEAAYLKNHFDKLDRKTRREVLGRSRKTERSLGNIGRRVAQQNLSPGEALKKERIRCPLLTDQSGCLLYPSRPITCRVYGIPTRIQGRARVCGRSGFQRDETYPAFDLDRVYAELFGLSRELLTQNGGRDPANTAGMLVSVARCLSTDTRDLISGRLAAPSEPS